MHMRTKWMLAVLSLLLPLLQVMGADKPTCAVLPFKAMGNIEPGMAEILAERVFFEIAKSGHYQMIERTQVERTLKENQISTIVSDTAGIEAGRLLGSKFVIIGSVGRLGQMTTINSRIVSVETGEIVAQAANDHEGRVEEMLHVAEMSARQLLSMTFAAEPVVAPTNTPRPPDGNYTAVSLDRTPAPTTTPTLPATGGAATLPVAVPAVLSEGLMVEGQPVSLDLGDGVRLDLIWIAPGQFPMGAGGRNRGTPVTITRGFWIGRYEVSNRQYRRFVTAAGYDGKLEANKNHLRHITKGLAYAGEVYPVIWVSWVNANSFCAWLTKQAQLSGQLGANGRVRLPTDAEWEYACRAGTRTRYYTGDLYADLGRAGWWEKNSGRGPKPSGQKEPNAWGLYDMHGNIAEWVADWWDSGYDPAKSTTDPSGPTSGRHRTVRGGAWSIDEEKECTSSFRAHFEPTDSEAYIGFRIAVSLN